VGFCIVRCSDGALWIQEVRHAASFRWRDLRAADYGSQARMERSGIATWPV